MMFLTLDNLAHRYGMLPSEALVRGTTLDLHVLDVSAKWNKHQQDIIDGKEVKNSDPVPSEQEMLAMIKRTRER